MDTIETSPLPPDACSESARRPILVVAPSVVAGVAAIVVGAAFAPRIGILTMVALGALSLAAWIVFLLRWRLDSTAVPLFVFVGYTLLSGFLSGGLVLGDLASMEFYDGDGRIFVTYFPFVFFAVIAGHHRQIRVLLHLGRILGAFVLASCVLWLAGADNGMFGDYRYLGLQTHHTGAGTYISMLMILLVIYGLEMHRVSHVLVGLALLVPILLTTSRQATIGALLSIVAIVLLRNRKLVLPIVIVIASLFAALPQVSPVVSQRIDELAGSATIENAWIQMRRLDWRPEYGLAGAIVGEQWNILARVLFYARGVKLFVDSPLVGAGFGRFNDYYVDFHGPAGILHVGTSGLRVSNTQSAHNSYLHLLAETGVIGLALLVWFWARLWKRLRSKEAELYCAREYSLAAIAKAVRFMILPVLVGALFGHAFATPSFGFLLLVSAGLVVSAKIPDRVVPDGVVG